MKVILDYDDVLNECNEEAIRKLNAFRNKLVVNI